MAQNRNLKTEPVELVVRGRLAFVNVFKPRKSMNAGQPDKFGVTVMIPKSDKAQVKKIWDTIKKLANEEFGPGSDKKLAPAGPLKNVFRDGQEQVEKGYSEFKDHMFFNCSSQQRPGVVDLNMQPVISPEGCYSGVDAFVQVNFAAFDNVSRGVTAYLNNIKVLRLLEAFTSRDKPEDVQWGETPAEVLESAEDKPAEEEDSLS